MTASIYMDEKFSDHASLTIGHDLTRQTPRPQARRIGNIDLRRLQ